MDEHVKKGKRPLERLGLGYEATVVLLRVAWCLGLRLWIVI